MKKAILDLGTNTFNLLIGQVENGTLNVIHSSKISVLLSMGGGNNGLITEEALGRAKEALKLFKSQCDFYDVKTIKAIGTSALRDSQNSSQLVDYARDEVGIEIQIIDGHQEAEYIYRGVKWKYGFSEPTIVMDIGGGSTEFIFADAQGVKKLSSLNIGISRIFQALNEPDEFTTEHIKIINQFLENGKCEFFSSVKSEILIGSSGSFETIYEMIYKKSFDGYGDTIEIPLDEVKLTLDWIITSTIQERLNHDWIADIRKIMLPIAALKIAWVINHFNIKRIIVSPFSLKEGVLNE